MIRGQLEKKGYNFLGRLTRDHGTYWNGRAKNKVSRSHKVIVQVFNWKLICTEE